MYVSGLYIARHFKRGVQVSVYIHSVVLSKCNAMYREHVHVED